jgi:hypothetical protein
MATKSRVRRLATAAATAVALVASVNACGNSTVLKEIGGPATPTVESIHFSRGLDETGGLVRDPQIATLLSDIDPAHIRHTDSMLTTFGTRNTFSDTMSTTRGIGAARRWIHSEFSQYARDCNGCLKTEFYGQVQNLRRVQGRDTTNIPVNIVDVIAWLPGRDTNRVVVMTGHYDSCVCSDPTNGGSFDSTSTALGADDDGSGTSAIVELARVFSKRYPKGLDASIAFVAVASEEQGLNGAATRRTSSRGRKESCRGNDGRHRRQRRRGRRHD